MANAGWVSEGVQQRDVREHPPLLSIHYLFSRERHGLITCENIIFIVSFALRIPMLTSLLAWVKVTLVSHPHPHTLWGWHWLQTRMINTRIRLEVKRSRRCYLLSIMEHEWCLKSSLQSSEETKDVSGTYAAYSASEAGAQDHERMPIWRIWNKELLRNRNHFGRVEMLYQYRMTSN